MLDRFKGYARQHYQKRNSYSLKLNDRNLERAFEVYLYGAACGYTRKKAVEDIVGYRYRRLENFLHDIQAWRPPGEWVYQKRVVKINCSYKSKNKKRELETDIQVILWTPINGELEQEELELLAERVYEALEELFPYQLLDALQCDPQPREDIIDEYLFMKEMQTEAEGHVDLYIYSYGSPYPRYHYTYEFKVYVEDILKLKWCRG